MKIRLNPFWSVFTSLIENLGASDKVSLRPLPARAGEALFDSEKIATKPSINGKAFNFK